MINKIHHLLADIHSSLMNSEATDMSLMTGQSGIVLFNYLYYSYLKDSGLSNGFDESIQGLAENSLLDMSPSFCTGKAGINWFFTFLSKEELISTDDRAFLCNDDQQLEMTALNMLDYGLYDFLHGAVGIAYYLLYSKTYTDQSFYLSFFKKLNGLYSVSSTKQMIPGFDFDHQRPMPGQINLGMSHGIPSILKFCIQCYRDNVCPGEAESQAKNIINYLLSHMNEDKTSCYFPSSIWDKGEHDSFCRLAWCYGDLGIGYVLYQSGIVFKDEPLKKLAIEILTATTSRRSLSETLVLDCGLCHGSSGIAHFYNRLFHITLKPSFEDARDFWVKKTIESLFSTNWQNGYQKYNSSTDMYEYTNSVLEGAAGIGLMLLSYLNKDFCWDYMLMLN